MTQHPTLHGVDVQSASCAPRSPYVRTASPIAIDVCSNCHPSFTGRERTVLASTSRNARFHRLRALAAE